MTITVQPAPPVAAWPALTELPAETAQQVFHACMEAFARPGTVQQMPRQSVPAPIPAALAPVLALVDLMTPLAALPTDEAADDPQQSDPSVLATRLAGRLTGARIVEPAQARFALALAEPADWADLNTGSHWSPEHGATLVQRVHGLTVAAPGTPGAWRLTGPGIPPTAQLAVLVDGLGPQWAAQRAGRTADYPAGVDCLLVTDDGELVGLPRTTTIEVS